MMVVPDATPVTAPVEEPMVATPGVPLVHVPPVGVLLSVVVAPMQAPVVPEMVPGKAFTVMVTLPVRVTEEQA